ncbi:hypothetical protein DENSPDRAFT_886438 [Dentipellis sp. KUC8613]|nr:hypothetical protein DENSPDRAFT_886438 [Dentipellis sp. KUC8613]
MSTQSRREVLEAKEDQLKKANKDGVKLQAFFKEANTQWHDIARRNIGFVDWAPKIATDVDEHRYTRDIGTFEIDPQKFKDNFQGNVVDFGNKYSSHELNTMFWPSSSNPSGLKIPSNRMLRI